ncbi:hypothetical protein ABB37_03415 [Leptomonas pyrrhocoris]|uniref:Flagellar attachment zone protein 1 conserved domain-containing protein n=1 Tax=Leptomonas pyrrhocoris TaxID=157538 RepID=A0A0M9G538_LEPPY|nr:hypothetical protein ABB37_03415 [Leptomonas pyrrhocoris]KPA82319.1 hypothetical protein ABB37_03415 [Leptomonas pyrrhocoris]|eukprot:XP_015660758.1 hypothetical protein ABB37_03415 [Leptomonas pyrrhocoris]
MASETMDGAVVSFEYLDSKKKWCWSVGQVTSSDDHLCTVKEWSGASVDKAFSEKVESEVGASKEEARKCQERLLSIRDQMDKESMGESKAEKERTAQDLSECLAEIGKHRRHYRSLEEDLKKLISASPAQLKVKAFTPSTNTLTILRSSVLKEVVVYSLSMALLSSEEYEAMESLSAQHRSQMAKELAHANGSVEEALNKFSEMQEQIHDLESKVKQLDNVPLASRGVARSEEISKLQDRIKELEALDWRCTLDENAALVSTNHSYDFPWDDGKLLLHHKPEETKAVVTAEIAFACGVPIYCVTTTALKCDDRNLGVEFSVSHPLNVSLKIIDERVANYCFPSLQHLHQNPLGEKAGLDHAIEEIERALGIPEGKHEGLYFSEFVENMPDMSFSNDKDAYESEIGDLLMLLDKINNENRSLQYTLDKATEELKKQVTAAQKDQESLNNEVARLRDIIAKLKDLADQQEKELEENRLQRQRAEQARFRRNLQPPAENAGNPEYAVTMDEYTRQRDAADEAQEAFEQEKAKAEEMFERLKQYEDESMRCAEHQKDLEEALAAKDQAAADSSSALESELLDVLMQLKASEACCKALKELNAQQAAELKEFRTRRIAAFVARETHGGLEIHEPSLACEQSESSAVNPDLLAQEPLYCVTEDEYKSMQNLADEQANQVGELTEQLASQQQHFHELQNDLQAAQLAEPMKEEVAAFRAKRNDALAARDADESLPTDEKPLSTEDAVARAVDPQQIADEPLYVATLEELQDARDAAEREKEAADDSCAAVEAELLDVLTQMKALEGENAALCAVGKEKDDLVDELKQHDCRANNSDKTKPQSTTSHKKVFEGDDWGVLLKKPHALHDAFVTDVSAACRVGREDVTGVAFELGSLHASVDVTHNSDLSGEAVTKMLDDYHYPNMWTLYANRDRPKEGLDAAEETIAQLEEARAAKEEEAARLADELEKKRTEAAKLADEVAAFRAKRNDALAARDADESLPTDEKPLSTEDAVARAVDPQQIADEPLYVATLEELKEQREQNAQMTHDMDVLGERIRDAMEPIEADGVASEAVLDQLEKLLKELEDAREAEQAARDDADEKNTKLDELRDVFAAEDERQKNDLEEARGEIERLQRELELLTDKLDEACKLYGDADMANAEGVEKMEAFADLVAAAQDSEKDARNQLEAKEDELAQLRQALEDARSHDDAIDALQDEVAHLQREKEIAETELVNAQKDLNDANQDLRAAEDKAAEKEREVESMTLDLDALNNRIQDLLEELEEKTDQYNQVIKDLDDFAKNQNREDEKELLQRLAAREQELFELQEARRGENDEHEKQVNVLQDQINRLRDQTDKDNTLHDGLQGELARSRKALADAEEAVRAKNAENNALRDDIEGMIDEHDTQMREADGKLEDKSKEVSDALERLEEMTAMVQDARESEESALRLRADSDAEVFRLQKELDQLKQLQNSMTEPGVDKDGLMAQVMDAEAQVRDAEAALRNKDAEFDDAERNWREKLNKAEDLNSDMRRLLKRSMAALSKSKDTMGNSANSLDSFRDDLKPMMQ